MLEDILKHEIKYFKTAQLGAFWQSLKYYNLPIDFGEGENF